MEKRRNKEMFCNFLYVRKRLFYTILAGCMMLTFANALYGQTGQKKITMKVTNVTTLQALYEVNRKSGNLVLFLKEEVERENAKISIDVKDLPLLVVVQKIVEKTSLTCVERDGRIVVTPKKGEMIKVCGFVTDQQQQPLPGVTVKIKGVTLGTITNEKGWYSLQVPFKEFILEYSFIGLETREVKYVGQDTLNVVLREDVKQINEVVVTGYGNVSKQNYTGASTTIKAEDVLIAGVSSIDQMLQGVIPGMLVWNTSGQVGATSKIRVRGTSTLLGSQEPVWVVDGVIQRDPQPFNSEDNTKFSVDADDIKQLAGNAISWLNPNDIESITVLKDASATAIYGSKAANGVIVITTKRAQVGKIRVNYNLDLSIGQRPRYALYDLMNSAERMELSRDIYRERRGFGTGMMVLPIGFEGLLDRYLKKNITLEQMNEEYQQMAKENTDWFDILFRNSFNHSHSLGISGGSEKIQNRTSLGYTQQKGEAEGNAMTVFTATSNTTVNLWERVLVNLLLKGTTREVKGFAYGVDPFDYAYNTSRVIPAYNEDGSLFYHEKISSAGTSPAIMNKQTYLYNILNERENTGSKNNVRSWGATFDLQWQILPVLTYQGLFSYTSSSSDMEKYATEQSFYITSIRGYEYGSVDATSTESASSPLPMGGILETDLTNTTTITLRNSLIYDHLFKDKHRVTLQFGIETNAVKTKGGTTKRYGYLPNRGKTFATPPASFMRYGLTVTDNTTYIRGEQTVVDRQENELSEYASAVYVYDDRYVLNLSGRYDASNRFGQDKNKRFQPTWSAGIKWRACNEVFLKNSRILNNLDLYVSYGYQGNAVTTISPELITMDKYSNLLSSYTLQIKSLPYPDLGWEKTKTWNIGIDASILNGRLNFTFNYFKKISDVLSSREVARENGMANGVVSGTTMKNHGYDFVINVIPVRVKNFTWQMSLNTSVTRNGVEKNNRVNTLDDYLKGSCVVDGRPFSTFYSWVFDGLEQEYGNPIFKYLDQEHVDDATDFLVKTGKFVPDFSGGLNMMFKYKRISLYALFAVQWGGYNRLPDLYESASMAYCGLPKPEQNVSRKLLNRWKKPGDESQIPSLPGATATNLRYYLAYPSYSTTTGTNENRYVMYNQSDVRVANTDFIRCRSLSLSYDFTNEWMRRTGINYLQVKASMTNPFMWVSDKKWDGLDPETGNWPARRVTSLSLQVMF